MLLMMASSASRWASCCSRETGFGGLVPKTCFLGEVVFRCPVAFFFEVVLTEGFLSFAPCAFAEFFLIVLLTGDVFAIPALLYPLVEWAASYNPHLFTSIG